jgi:hypothetical protein
VPLGASPFTDTLSVVKDPAVTLGGVIDTELTASPLCPLETLSCADAVPDKPLLLVTLSVIVQMEGANARLKVG